MANTEYSVFLDTTKRRKWYFRAASVACIVFLLLSVAIFTFGMSFSVAQHPPVTYEEAIQRYHYYYSAANDKKVALTFDDGPNPPATEHIMDALEKTHTPATFFFIGKSTFVRPDIAKEAIERGFDVEDHSFTHAHTVSSSFARLALELNSTSFLLNQITERETPMYRPPYLEGIGIDPTVNPYIEVPENVKWALSLGYLPVGSDIDPKDWLATSPQAVVDGLKRGLQNSPNGHIVLFHDDVNTAKAMEDAVAYLTSEGYTIVSLKELLTPPTVVALSGPLAYGDTDKTTGGDVSRLQWFLYEQRYLDPYALSGVFDSQTRNAVINYQTKNKLINPSNPEKAGVVGASTIALIKEQSADAHPMPAQTARASGLAAVWEAGKHALRVTILGMYVNFFPVLRTMFEIMVTVTLLMVVARTLGLLALLIARYLRDRKATEMPVATTVGASILIPAYNEEENIAATVESVIAATYHPREVIVIDDGSKDRTSDEVRSVIAAHPEENIRLIVKENGGKAQALNAGVEAAQYGIIVVLDADAVLDKEAIARFMPHFNDPLVGAVAGKVRTTSSNNLLDMFQTLEYAIGQNIDKKAFSTIGAIGVVPGPAGAWRKEAIMAAGGFHTDTLVEDQEMTLSMLHLGWLVGYEEKAVAYTETPHNIESFLKQRFRWVYGTMQCFWKHKKVFVGKPDSIMSLVVMPNIFVYNILLPLTYPFADSAMIFGLVFGEWQTLVMPFIIFTIVDLGYAAYGLRGEPNKWKLMIAVPLQRVVYRQLLYYTVYKGLIRAIEGTGSGWNKFKKMGETRRFFLSAMGGVEAVLGLEVPQPAMAAVGADALAGTADGPGLGLGRSIGPDSESNSESREEKDDAKDNAVLHVTDTTEHYAG